jgi:hypothetical protein
MKAKVEIVEAVEAVVAIQRHDSTAEYTVFPMRKFVAKAS